MTDFFDFLNRNSGVLSLLFSFVVATATALYAILTHRLVEETRRMRAIQSEPQVAVRVEQYEAYFHFVQLIVENIGLGPAYDVQLAVSPDFRIDGHESLSDMGIFKHGIRYMAPRQRISFYLSSLLGQTDEIQKRDSKFNFTVTASYRSVSGTTKEQQYPIDFLHLVGLTSLGKQPLQSIANDLGKMTSAIERIQSGSSHAQVDVYTHADRQRQRKERQKQRAQLSAKQNTVAQPGEKVSHRKTPIA